MTATTSVRTVPVCRLADLEPERGVAALIGGGTDGTGGVQVALFRLHDGRLLAVDHRDPFTGANVMARGIVGSRGDVPTVASPLHKQVYDLVTGRCLDDATLALGVHPVTVDGDGVVHVALGGTTG